MGTLTVVSGSHQSRNHRSRSLVLCVGHKEVVRDCSSCCMATTEDLNLPEAGETEPAADTTQEGTEQEVPEAAAMAAVSTHSPSTSKVPSPAPEAPSTVPSSSTAPKEVLEEPSSGGAEGGGEGAAGLRDILRNVSEESNNHRVSTFMTEVDDCEDVPEAGPKAAAANLTATMADIAEKITEGVEIVGGIEDVVEKKESTPAKAESAVKEASPEPVKEVSSEPVKESSSDPVKETSPGLVKEATPEPIDKKEAPEQSPGPTLEPIGAVEDLKAEVNALLSSSDKDNDKVIEIAVIEEPEDSANDVESKIESVLNEIREKKEIIEEAKEVLDDVEPKEPADTGSVIDIRVVEEATDGAQDIVKPSQEGFYAEVIPDNAEVDIVAEADEEVIEYTLNAADAIPIGAIAVAAFAIFLALIFYYN